MKNPQKAVVIFSGGQDSTTCLFYALKKFGKRNVEAITFAYGQKHGIEVIQSKVICEKANVKQTVINIDFLNTIVESALTSQGDVNEINDKGLPSSFVPNRNQLFITLAHSYAQKIGAQNLVTGVCQTDYSGYPDCRQEFIDSVTITTNLGSQSNIRIYTPLMYLTKAETWKLAHELNCLVDVIVDSHTCYNGDRKTFNLWGYGCDKCPACELRKKGFEEHFKPEQVTHILKQIDMRNHMESRKN
jgi:7-cyano-7-deazaguanine synthase